MTNAPLLTKADVIKFYKNWSAADLAVFDSVLEAIGQPVEFYKPPRSTYIRVQDVGYVPGTMCFAFLQPGFISISPRVEHEWPGTYRNEEYPEWRQLDLSNRSGGHTRSAAGTDRLAVAVGEVRCQKCGLLTKRGVDEDGRCDDCR